MAKKVITCGGVTAILCGIIMIVIAIMTTGNETVDKISKDVQDIESGKEIFFVGTIIFGLLAIIASCLAIGMRCCANRKIYRCCTGILLVPVFLLLIVVGGGSLWLSNASEEQIQEQCTKLAAETAQTIAAEAPTGASEAGYTFGDVEVSLEVYKSIRIDEYMCSVECPCPATTKSGEWSALGAEALAATNRPITQEFIFQTAEGLQTYESYKACIESETAGVSEYFKAFAKAFRSQSNFSDVMEFIEFFEGEYQCAGICSSALFSWSVSVTQGRPTQTCLISIKDDISTVFMVLGLVTFLSGVVLLCVFICQYCLWFGKD